MGLLWFKKRKQSELVETLKKKHYPLKIVLFILGTFISAVSFNLFYVPNNFVTGGVTGLSIVFNYLTKIPVSSLVFFGNLIMIGIGFIFLGGKKTAISAIGSMLYTLFIIITADISSVINFSFDNTLFYALAAGLCGGFGEALVYRLGYSTGGTSIIGLIIADKTKKPVGKAMRYISFAIIALGGFIFGYTMIMYALIIVTISTFIVDKMTIGISDSKMFFVRTNKEKEVSEFIMQVIESGVTEFETKGGFSGEHQHMLMCVVSTDKYTFLTSAIKEIDKDAFIVVSDCYEVLGGTKRNKLPI